MAGYYKIARHYNYSINYVLNKLNYDGIIITEGWFCSFRNVSILNEVYCLFLTDDLEVSPDVLDYLQALYRV